jgi:hypothetical protein
MIQYEIKDKRHRKALLSRFGQIQTSYAYNLIFRPPKRVIQDVLESLAKVPHNFYNHQEVILCLTKSNNTIFEICSDSGQNTTIIL